MHFIFFTSGVLYIKRNKFSDTKSRGSKTRNRTFVLLCLVICDKYIDSCSLATLSHLRLTLPDHELKYELCPYVLRRMAHASSFALFVHTIKFHRVHMHDFFCMFSFTHNQEMDWIYRNHPRIHIASMAQ